MLPLRACAHPVPEAARPGQAETREHTALHCRRERAYGLPGGHVSAQAFDSGPATQRGPDSSLFAMQPCVCVFFATSASL